MNQITQEKEVRQIFIISLLLKGLNAVLEILGGILFLFTGVATSIVESLIHGELVEDPTDFISNTIQHLLPYSGNSQLFASVYLFSHGIIKIFLIIALLRNKLWAYPAAITVFSLFVIYQLYRYSHTHSVFLMLLTIFDLAIIWMTWHEYKLMKSHKMKKIDSALQ